MIRSTNPCQENHVVNLLQPPQINITFKLGRKAMAGWWSQDVLDFLVRSADGNYIMLIITVQ
jgi:hypothetical protein